ncbi:MAG: hypothetical protein ABEI74_04740 [Candidatus Pacearchaeota archaeon]
MSSVRNVVVGFIIIAFFAFAIISFSISYQAEWDANQSIGENPQINKIYSNVNQSLQNSQREAQARNGTLYQEDPTQAGDVSSLIFGGVSAIAQTFSGIAYDIFGAVLQPVVSALGLPREATVIIGSVMTTIFLVVIVLLGWQLLRTGK